MGRPLEDVRPFGPFIDSKNECTVIIKGDSLGQAEFKGREPPSIEEQNKMSEEELDEMFEQEFGTWVTTKNFRVENCKFETPSLHIANPKSPSSRYELDLNAKNAEIGNQFAGEAWMYDDSNTVLGHLIVPDSFKGTDASDILFMLFYGHAIASGSDTIEASIGGGSRTANFFKKMGVPDDEVKIVERPDDELTDSAQFEIDIEDMGELDTDVRLEVNGNMVNR